MRKSRACRAAMLALCLAPCARSSAAVVDFDAVSPGTVFGAPAGHVPSEVVLTQAGVIVSVESYRLGSFSGFFDACVGGIYAGQFPTPALQLNNIAVLFNFGGLPFAVEQVSFDYLEFGGVHNLAVNGGTLLELGRMSDLPLDLGGGVTAVVDADRVLLNGDVRQLLIGGQELAIDNVVAVPEPATALFLGLAALAGAYIRRRPARTDLAT